MRRALRVVVALALVAPQPLGAQTDDAIYCATLSELALRYLGKQQEGTNKPDSETKVAVDRCEAGDTASGIPILERKLRDGGFTLPARRQ